MSPCTRRFTAIVFGVALSGIALSGIAVPESFENGLRKLGAKVEVIARFADHHRFHGPEIKQFIERCVRRDVHCMVTTEKDYVRFPKMPAPEIPFYFMRVEIEILRGLQAKYGRVSVERMINGWKYGT